MRRSVILLTLLAIALCSNAQLLWKVTGNGAKAPSYLFGTHHVAPLSVLESTPGFGKAFGEVGRVYGEIVMEQLKSPAAQMRMAQMGMAPADSTLSRVVSAECLARVDSLLAATGVLHGVAALEPMKPAMVTNLITMIFTQKEFPEFDPSKQLDDYVQVMAREKGKEVMGLETVDTQLEALFGTPISKQAADLEELMGDLDKSLELTHTLANAYMAADLDKLADIISNADGGIVGEDADRLLVSRNNAWIDILLGVIPTASVMVVVGAGHLPGDDGLIAKLRQAGYKVEPVK